jgi:hypothetical protein
MDMMTVGIINVNDILSNPPATACTLFFFKDRKKKINIQPVDSPDAKKTVKK